MKLASLLAWKGTGPKPSELGYDQLNLINENGGINGQTNAMVSACSGLTPSDLLVANCEHHTQNVSAAIRVLDTVRNFRSSQPTPQLAAYVTEQNPSGHKLAGFGAAGVTDRIDAQHQIRDTSDKLSGWVDQWVIEGFAYAKTGTDQPMTFYKRSPSETCSITLRERLACLPRDDHKMVTVLLALTLLPNGGTPLKSAIIDRDLLYSQVLDCKMLGVYRVGILAWDDADFASGGDGRMTFTNELAETLKLIRRNF